MYKLHLLGQDIISVLNHLGRCLAEQKHLMSLNWCRSGLAFIHHSDGEFKCRDGTSVLKDNKISSEL